MTKLLKKTNPVKKGNRTFTAAGLLALLALVHSLPEVQAVLNDWVPVRYHSLIGLLGAAATMVQMRLITSTPPGQSE